jgi:hypothetical protein
MFIIHLSRDLMRVGSIPQSSLLVSLSSKRLPKVPRNGSVILGRMGKGLQSPRLTSLFECLRDRVSRDKRILELLEKP